MAYIHYFCGSDTKDPEGLKATEPCRVALYKLTVSLLRAYANIADEMLKAGYSAEQAAEIKQEVTHFEQLRQEIKISSGDFIDLKQYEPAMRYLLDSYIGAEESRVLANFNELGLVELLAEQGKAALDKLPKGIRDNNEAMSETIENNLRKVIIEESPTNPMYYAKMSALLDELIKLRKEATLDYEKYLQEVIELAGKVKKPNASQQYPDSLDNHAKRALYDNLNSNEALANELDRQIRLSKPDDWRYKAIKQKMVRQAIEKVLLTHGITEQSTIDAVFELVKNQKDY
jgi:type I restriction enzyme R subunit